VADQLQTNYASDLRHMLKSVFDSYTLDIATRLDTTDDSSSGSPDTFHRRASLTESSASSHLSSRTVTTANNYHSATLMLGTLLTESNMPDAATSLSKPIFLSIMNELNMIDIII